jgi:phage repressor protein C with HTH and peptisase S24 domain
MKKLLIMRRISGASMLPDFKHGQIVLGWGYGKLKIGDTVILVHQGLEKIKRVSVIEGDKLYLLGDNSPQSTDSRQFGWIDRAHVVARVVWPRQ